MLKQSFGSFVAAMGLIIVGASQAAAQTPPSTGGAPPAAAQEPKKVSGSLSAGLSRETGSTDLFATSVSGNLAVQHSPKTTFSLDVTHSHASTKPAGSERITVGNGQIGHFRFEHDARDHVVVLAQTTGTNDRVRKIERVEQFGGVGVGFGAPERAWFRVIPIAAATVQNKNVELEENFQAGFGVMQDFTLHMNPMWSLTESVLFRRYLGNDADHATNLSATLTGKMTQRLGMQLAFIHSHENLVAPGAIKRYQKVLAGLNYTF
jgi:hypothetical protein